MRKTLLTWLLCACMLLSGCVSEPEAPVIVDRVPISFIATSDVASVVYDATAVAMNYITCLVKGDYATALEYVQVPEGVLFDANTLQSAMLVDGFGRGESVTFYKAIRGREVLNDDGTVSIVSQDTLVSVEYDLTASGSVNTVSKQLPIIKQPDGSFAISVSEHIVEGSLKFKVPKYVEVYINGAYVPQSFMGNDYVYEISTGVPKIGDEESLTLTLKTNFGVEQSYDLVFLGKAARSRNSVNDAYFSTKNEMSVFTIDVPREVRESALAFIEIEVMPRLLNDMVSGTAWEVASVRDVFGEKTQVDTMFSDYYRRSTEFAKMTTKEGGKYVFYPVTCYDFSSSDTLAERRGSKICISDYNVMDLYISYGYQFLYTRGSAANERNSTGTNDCLVQLSFDANGDWYVYCMNDRAFRVSVN